MSLQVRNANFATGIILTTEGKERWIEADDLERFCDNARVVIVRAREASAAKA